MAVSGITVYQGQPSTSEAVVYTVPSGKTLFLRAIRCANTSGSTATVRVSLMPAGGSSATAANQIIPDVQVLAHDVVSDSDGHVLPAGGKVAVAASVNTTVSVTISGVLL